MPRKLLTRPCAVCGGAKEHPGQAVCIACRILMRDLDRLHGHEAPSVRARRAEAATRRDAPATRTGALRWAGKLPREGR